MRQAASQAAKPAVRSAGAGEGCGLLIDLTDPDITLDLCHAWLRQAHNAASDEAFRRLVADVMGDLEDLGSMDGELVNLVLGALGSVQSALEVRNLV